jgi:hypothetical protein
LRHVHQTALAVALALLAVGCSATPPRRPVAPTTDLLFGPDWAGIPTFDLPRSDWPAATAGPLIHEHVEYRTMLYDLHGRSGRDDGYVQRRFRSVRTGSTGRRRY